MPLYMMGDVLCGHWDVGKQRNYQIPPNSPTIRRWRHVNTHEFWSDTWGESRVEGAPRYPKIYDWVLDQLSKEEVTGYADLGCGVGILLQRVAMQLGFKGIGFDNSDQALKFARQLYLPVEELNLKNLKDEHLDGISHVTATFMLEWLDDAARAHIVSKVRKANATFICAVDPNGPNKCSKRKLATLLDKFYEDVEIKKVDKMLVAVCRPKVEQVINLSLFEGVLDEQEERRQSEEEETPSSDNRLKAA